MQRILIIGSPGAGKSTLSRTLAGRLGLPHHPLDQLFWLPGWVERDRAEGRTELAGILERDRWIIDGNYGSTLPMRVARADTVVWLDYPTWLCLTRAVRRWWQYRGKTRPDMTEDCPERFDLEFMLYIVNFRQAWQHRNAAALQGFDGTVVRLRSPAETAAWLDTVERAA